jgi:large subunit ribosomal protein L10
MAITKEKKEEILKGLEDKFGKAKAVYFADYRGLSVKEIGELRKKLKEEGAEYLVAKKTLMKLSVKNAKLPEVPNELMEGPVGVAFGFEDVVIPVKVLNDFAKEAEALTILGGLVEGKYISKEEAIELAKLPSRDELLAKLVGSMKAPISGFHGVLSGILRDFVGVLKAYDEKKGESAPTETAPAEEEATKEAVKAEAPKQGPDEEAVPEKEDAQTGEEKK